MQVQLKPWGNSQGIRFSKEFLKNAGFQPNDMLTAEISDGKIVLSRGFRHRSLKERAAEYGGIPEAKRITRMNEWRRLIHERQQSGQSVRAWCRQNGIRENSYGWLSPPERVALAKRNGGSHRPDWVFSNTGIFIIFHRNCGKYEEKRPMIFFCTT